jgi:predicted DNA-binding transcriptional regulator YafY
VYLSGLWLSLQSDKGISSIRLAEALGVSQPTIRRMGHALRLMVGREQALDGIVEIDGLYVGASRGGIGTMLRPPEDAKASRKP